MAALEGCENFEISFKDQMKRAYCCKSDEGTNTNDISNLYNNKDDF